MTRTITYDLTLITGSAAAGKVLTFDLLTPFAARAADAVVQLSTTSTSDENGAGTVTLAVPSSGAYLYKCTLPDGQSFSFSLAAGSATTLHALMAATVGSTVGSADAITTAVDAAITTHTADTTSVHGIADTSALATATDVSSAVSSHTGTGTGAHAATAISVTPSGNLAATTVQAALEELQGDIDGMGGASDVGDLTTTGGSSTNMLRVAAAGGLEYRTVAQVLADIGAAPTASPTFTGTVTMAAATVTGNVTVTNTVGLRPNSNTTSWPLVQDAAGAAIVSVNSTARGIAISSGSTAYSDDIATVFNGASGRIFTVTGDGRASFGGKVINDVVLEINMSGAKTSGQPLAIRSSSGTMLVNPVSISTTSATFSFGAASAGSAFYMSSPDNFALQIRNGKNVAIGFGTLQTATAAADIAASTTSAASLRLRSGTAPTSPKEGDIWFDGTNLKMYDGATTRTISWT